MANFIEVTKILQIITNMKLKIISLTMGGRPYII